MSRVPRLILSRGAPDLGVPIIRLGKSTRPNQEQGSLLFAVAYFYDAAYWCWSHWHPVLKRSLGCHVTDPAAEVGDPNRCPHCTKTHRERSHYAPVAIARPSSDGPFTPQKLPNMSAFQRAILGIPQTSAKDFEAPDLAGRTLFIRWHSPKRIRNEFQWDIPPKHLPAPFDFTTELERHLFLDVNQQPADAPGEPGTVKFDPSASPRKKGGAG